MNTIHHGKSQSAPIGRRSAELLEFVHGLSWRNVPSERASRTKNALLDSLGCGIFGTVQEWSSIIADEMIADGSRGQATVFGRREKLSAPAAALCNGTAIHGFELDDILDRTVGHPGAIVIPAALAVAENIDASGERLLLGILAGYEVMNRVGLAVGLQPTRQGFHKTAVFGPIGAAVGAGVVLGLDLDQLLSAVGLACSTASGIKSFSGGQGGGMMKRLHAGRAAESGARMAQLAARGFTAPKTAIDGHFGLLEVFGGEGAEPEQLTKDLGTSWAIDRMFVKLHPCCGWVQSTIEGSKRLRGKSALKPDDIAEVTLGVSAYVSRNNGAVTPLDTMGAQYSLPYCAALALTADPGDFSMYEAPALDDPGRRSLAQRVKVVVDPEAESVYPDHSAVRLRLKLRDGEERNLFLRDPRGAAANPCGEDDLKEKFRRLTSRVMPTAAVETLIGGIYAADRAPSTRALTALVSESVPSAPTARTRAN